MSGIAQDWKYAETFDASRAQRLLGYSAFPVVVELLANAKVVQFSWEPFNSSALLGCNRASFRLEVSPDAYDAFFNSPTGYRGQYALSTANGEAANRLLLASWEPALLDFIIERKDISSALVASSLRASQAKVWIDESEVDPQLRYGEVAIVYAPWEKEAEASVSLLAPLGKCLEVKGGWLNAQGQERCNPAKKNRSKEIHNLGYS
jgi:hypothetical protein